MNRKLMNYLAAFLLIIAAVWNIRCESEKKEVRERQAAFLQYIHENSKPYKQSLKMDTLFAQRLDSIELLGHSSFGEGTVDDKVTSKFIQKKNGKER